MHTRLLDDYYVEEGGELLTGVDEAALVLAYTALEISVAGGVGVKRRVIQVLTTAKYLGKQVEVDNFLRDWQRKLGMWGKCSRVRRLLDEVAWS